MLDVYLGPDSDEETLGRWFKWLIWSVRDSESEEREARAHVKYLVKRVPSTLHQPKTRVEGAQSRLLA
jgi:hypothetical protein